MLNVYINFHCAFSCIIQHHVILLCQYGANGGAAQLNISNQLFIFFIKEQNLADLLIDILRT